MKKAESILYRTGQAWKYSAGFVGIMIAGAIVIGAQGHKGEWFVVLNVAGGVVALAGGAFAILSIRCPKCGARWGWMGFKRRHGPRGFGWVARQTACPACGASADELGSISHR